MAMTNRRSFLFLAAIVIAGHASAEHEFLATVAVGTAVDAGHNAAALSFTPVGSAAKISQGFFNADTEGDFVSGPRLWRAIVLAPAMGQSPPLRFSDGFSKKQTPKPGSLFNTDRLISGWHARAGDNNSVNCVRTGLGNSGGLQLSGPHCGIETSDEVSLPSMFSEPLTLSIRLNSGDGNDLNSDSQGPAAQLCITFGELSVDVSFDESSMVHAAVETAGSKGSPFLHASLNLSNCVRPSAGAKMVLNANAVNCTLELSCSNSSSNSNSSSSGDGGSSGSSSTWRGLGTPHRAHCRDDYSAAYDCGRSKIGLQVNSGSATAHGIDLFSCLLPGADPLRPWASVPAYPAVLRGITDEVGFSPLRSDLGKAQPRAASEGIVDVSQPPFSADPTGKTDSTRQIQAAVDYARENYCACFFPSGRYLISDTIIARSITRIMASGHVPGMYGSGRAGATDDFLLDGVSSRYVPNFLVGSSEGLGATIVLAPKADDARAKFNDPSKPAFAVDFFFENAAGIPEPNEQYNSVMASMRIEIAPSLIGAVGVRLRGAQGSGLEDVTVHVGDGLAGVVGGCGSGGAHHGLYISGGRYGMDLRESQPTATVSGTTLVGQKCAGLVFAGFESLSAVGLNITAQEGYVGVVSTADADSTFMLPGAGAECSLAMMPTGPNFKDDYQKTNPGIVGKMSFVDSSISFSSKRGNTTAFLAVRSLFLQNVYVQQAALIYSIAGKSLPAGSRARWTRVGRLVVGVDPPATSGFQLHAALYVDGKRQTSQTLIDAVSLSEPPLDLVSKHMWPQPHPSFQSPQCVNVKHFFGAAAAAKGDGASDDYEAIQSALDTHKCVYLPRGLYVTSRTIQVHSGCAMVGVAKHLTRITSMDAGLLPGKHPSPNQGADVLPVVEVLDGNSTDITWLSSLSISVWNSLTTTSALHWHASNGVYRQIHANRANRCGSLFRPGCKTSVPINYPLTKFAGAKNVKVFTFFEEDCCHNHSTSVSHSSPGEPAYWPGFLAGPQGPKYRHLLVQQAENVSFYHLNCEHGTGESICEFSESRGVSVFGLKTEGRYVTLWVRDCDDISVFGTGGCGCSANDTVYPPEFAPGYPPTLYRVERTPNFQFASLIDQHSMVPLGQKRNKDMFDESPCPPSITHMLYDDQGGGSPTQTQTFDRPALYLQGDPGHVST